MSIRNLDALTEPASIVLVGAGHRPGSLGTLVLDRLLAGGFRGHLHLVNPKYRTLRGRPCHRRLAEIEGRPDLAVIVTPPPTVPKIVATLAEMECRAAIIMTAGLDDGTRTRMLTAARRHCLRILGPNCLGLQVPGIGLDATFAHMMARRGNLALLSQSGAIATALIDWAEGQGLGFSAVASMGDMSDVDVGDLIDWFGRDAETRAILLYVEHVTQARKFMSAARAAARVKPVIAIKAGRNPDSARAATSHTGALAGADAVYDAAFHRAGILRVRDLGELFEAAEALSRHRPVRGNCLAIVTNGGGAGVLAADALPGSGARLATLDGATIGRLDALLPGHWPRRNPVDLIGDADGDRYGAALAAVLDDPGTDAVLAMYCPTATLSASAAAGAIADARKAHHSARPVLAAMIGGASTAIGSRMLEAAGVASFETPARAVRGFGYLARHAAGQRQLMRTPPASSDAVEIDAERIRAVIERALEDDRALLTEPEAKAVLDAAGIEVASTLTAGTPDEAGEAARGLLEGPAAMDGVVLKILSRDITHKSDLGGVRLRLHGPAEVAEAARAMVERISDEAPQARVDGFTVQPMVVRPHARELLVGIASDRVFGPVIAFGAGGTDVEVIGDRALALPPLDALVAADMVEETAVGRLLAPHRGRAGIDRGAVTRALLALSQVASRVPEIAELDVNPLLADAQGACALDARIVVRRRPPGEPAHRRLAIRPYPAEWAGEAATRDDEITMRPIRPADEALYHEFLAALSTQDVQDRFFGSIGNLGHEQIARFTQIDYDRAMALVAISRRDGALLGVARLATDPERVEAEFAVLVRSDLKRRGIGHALMTRLIDYARAEGIGVIWGDVLDTNAAMRAFCRRLGFTETEHGTDRSLQRFTLRLQRKP